MGDVASPPDVAERLEAFTGLPPEAADDLVIRGILALGGLNIRVTLMEQLEGIGGCEPGELSMFDGKLSMLLRDADPDGQEERFQRVLTLAELPEPDLSQSPAIDVERLLAARASPEPERCARGCEAPTASMTPRSARASTRFAPPSAGRSTARPGRSSASR